MSITKIALVSAAVVVGGFLIIKRLLTDNEVAEKRKKIVKTDVDEVNYDILISDVKKIYQNNMAAYQGQRCKIQILNNIPTAQMYAILKNEGQSLSFNVGDNCISVVLFVNNEIEYIKFYSYKSISKDIKDIFSLGKDIFEQDIE
ncbi:hypothetical protein [Bacteroides togonis]|uniref:hypothetical protein n=1 Tax=Bacteroides togonis TaxID=1917883 RepID=UPI00094AE9D1|nr:hypothetical protein [Bacteroides togonis]